MAKQIEQSCRTCKYLIPGEDKNGKPRVVKNQAYMCGWKQPLMFLPSAITETYGFRAEYTRHYMRPEDGKTCPVWEAK